MDHALPLAAGEDLLSPSSYWLKLGYSYNSCDVIGQGRDGPREPGLEVAPCLRLSTRSVEPEQLGKWSRGRSAGCHETASLPKRQQTSRQCSYLGSLPRCGSEGKKAWVPW